MTLFVPNEQGQPEATDNAAADVYSSLVGEGKKYRDNEALAKSRIEADRFIETLKADNEEVRKELKARISLEDALAKITAPSTNAGTSNSAPQGQSEPIANGGNGTQTGGLSIEDAERLFEKKLIQTQNEAIQQQNMSTVMKAITSAWGADTEMTLRAKTVRLGLTPAQVDTIAANNPTAALAMFGLGQQEDPRQGGNVTPPRSTGTMPQSTSGLKAGVKNAAYWEAMRKAQPALYFSKSMTIQRHEEAQRLGDAYHN